MLEIAQQLASRLDTAFPQIIAFCLTSASALAVYWLRPRVNLIYGRANNSLHTLRGTDTPAQVYCEKLYIQNVGKKPAEKVDVMLNGTPSEFTVFPPCNFHQQVDSDGNLILSLPFIAARELIIIDTIHINKRAAEILSVRCPERVGKQVNFWVQKKPSKAVMIAIACIMLLGVFFLFQIVVGILIRLA